VYLLIQYDLEQAQRRPTLSNSVEMKPEVDKDAIDRGQTMRASTKQKQVSETSTAIGGVNLRPTNKVNVTTLLTNNISLLHVQ
jgi:hypothetical protein